MIDAKPARSLSDRIMIAGVLILGIILVAVLALGSANRSTDMGQNILGGAVVIALALVIVFRPDLGAYLLVFTITTDLSTILTDLGFPSINKVIVWVSFVSVIVGLFLRERATRPKLSRVEWLILAYLFVQLLSVLVAADKAQAIIGVRSLVKNTIIVVTVNFALRRRQHWKRAIWLLIIIMAALASMGIYQIVSGDTTFAFGGLAEVSTQEVVDDLRRPRVGGPIGKPNFWGIYLAAALPFVIYRTLDERKIGVKILGGIAAILLVTALFNTYSRGAFLALAVSAILIVVERRARPYVVLLALLLVFVSEFFLPVGYLERIGTIGLLTSGDESEVLEESSFRGRTSELKAGLGMFANNPILGVGISNYENNYLDYARRVGLERRNEPRQAHSLYVEVLAETGLLGGIAFGVLFWSLMSGLARVRNKLRQFDQDEFARWQTWLAALQISIATYLIGSLFLHGDFMRFLWLLVALGIAGIKISERLIEQGQTQPSTQMSQ